MRVFGGSNLKVDFASVSRTESLRYLQLTAVKTVESSERHAGEMLKARTGPESPQFNKPLHLKVKCYYC